jgi:uncharacterized protein HemX
MTQHISSAGNDHPSEEQHNATQPIVVPKKPAVKEKRSGHLGFLFWLTLGLGGLMWLGHTIERNALQEMHQEQQRAR